MSRLYFSRAVEFTGIASGCFYQGDSVPGVTASLQPPATICDRFAIKNIVPNLTISPTDIVTSAPWHPELLDSAVFNYKFGNATLTRTRILQIRPAGGIGPSVPITG